MTSSTWLHNSGRQETDSAARFSAIFHELDAVKLSGPSTNSVSSVPVSSQEMTRAKVLNQQILDNLHASPPMPVEGHGKIGRIVFRIFRVAAALFALAALAELMLLLKGDESSSFATGLTELLSTILRVLGYFYIPIVFGGLAILHLTGRFKVDWIVILLACLALCPQFFPILSEYMEEISLGLQGFRAKPRSSVIRGLGQPGLEPSAPISAGGATNASQSTAARETAPPTLPVTTFQRVGPLPVSELPPPATVFMDEARKILKTLWHYQNTLYPGNPSNRWCFTVPRRSADYMSFSLGQLQVISADLIGIDGRGFTFLNDRGLAYCTRFDREVLEFPAMYDNFGPE
jgi:hypothetical protein